MSRRAAAKSQLPADKQQSPLLLPLDDWCLTWSCGWHGLDCSLWATSKNITNISVGERRMIFRQDGCKTNRLGDENIKMLSGCLNTCNAKSRVLKTSPSPTNTTRILKAVEELTHLCHIYIHYIYIYIYLSISACWHRLYVSSQSPVSVLLLPLCSGKPLSC